MGENDSEAHAASDAGLRQPVFILAKAVLLFLQRASAGKTTSAPGSAPAQKRIAAPDIAVSVRIDFIISVMF
jgi:hypothetical protein